MEDVKTRRAKREAGRFNPLSLPSKHPHIGMVPTQRHVI